MIDLEHLRDAVNRETADLDIAAAWLFGSEAAGKPRPDSDVDVGLLGGTPIDPLRLVARQAQVSRRIGRDAHIVDLRTASPIIAVQATRNGILLADRRPTERHLFVASLLSRYHDLLRVRREAERALLRRFGVGR